MPPPLAPPAKPFAKAIGASGLVEARRENTLVGVPVPGLVKSVKVAVWDRVQPGAPLTVTVTATPRLPGAPIYVTAHGTFGVVGYRSPGDAGTATWVLGADFTRSAGLVTFRATAGTLHAASESRITAGEPADPLLVSLAIDPWKIQAI